MDHNCFEKDLLFLWKKSVGCRYVLNVNMCMFISIQWAEKRCFIFYITELNDFLHLFENNYFVLFPANVHISNAVFREVIWIHVSLQSETERLFISPCDGLKANSKPSLNEYDLCHVAALFLFLNSLNWFPVKVKILVIQLNKVTSLQWRNFKLAPINILFPYLSIANYFSLALIIAFSFLLKFFLY